MVAATPSYPLGRRYAGYEAAFSRETQDGINIFRSWARPAQSTDFFPRLTSYFSFAATSLLYGGVSLPTVDFLLVESPPPFLGPTGIALAAIKKARFIFNVADLWPESIARLGVIERTGVAFKLAGRLEEFCYRHSWLVTTQSRSTLQDIERRFPATPTFHLSNGCDTSKYGKRFATTAARYGLQGGPHGPAEPAEFVCVYAGLHGLSQGLSQILDTAAQLKHTRARFVLVGDGPEKKMLVASARARGLSNVAFLDLVAPGEIPALLASADAIVATLKTDFLGSVPSKIYEAMASERPLILAAAGEAAAIAAASGALTVAPGDAVALAGAVQRLMADPDLALRVAASARKSAVENYDRGAIAAGFFDKLEAAL